jgi:hypothetical protein
MRTVISSWPGYEIIHDDGTGTSPKGWYVITATSNFINEGQHVQGPYCDQKMAIKALRTLRGDSNEWVLVWIGFAIGFLTGTAFTLLWYY